MNRLDLPPVWAAMTALAMWLWAGSVDILQAPALAPLGWALIAAGVLLVAWAALWFVWMKTPIEPRHTPRALITDGPFAWTRNPIYRGLIMASAGWALALGEASGLIFAVAYGGLLYVRFVLPEEDVARRTFGATYDDWAARVRWRL